MSVLVFYYKPSGFKNRAALPEHFNLLYLAIISSYISYYYIELKQYVRSVILHLIEKVVPNVLLNAIYKIIIYY